MKNKMINHTHTIEEIDELKDWFDKQQSLLPEALQIDSCAYTPNLALTLSMLFEQAYLNYTNPKMQGCIYLLKKIKKKIEDEGVVTSEGNIMQ